ncbi:Cobyrinic acid ac-diamide synthase [Methanobacterium lacus]|uniref:Cobyrinic acid ac-diamide synthase n=1 Tax=Methanobacterium lacus (strain AL-21) TaxID=877455 RepID=F0T6R7_METLA|nr:AAA family ATPase [Methanobacterium lacus]ADZ08300.1 Cobyrinic acid ac-diamide synthase [Methanobacterium lacus]
MKKIGFLYVKGALPAFEDFGHLPTHIVGSNGTVNGFKMHKELDGLIIPGGSIVESQSVGRDIEREIHKMNAEGKFIFGMCSGFQLLANQTDIGRKSPCPVEKKGMGILDVSFSPMVGTDRVKAKIVDDSFLTKNLTGTLVSGFHCHTYGNITGDAKTVLKSLVKRTDYQNNPREITSGVTNDEGNAVGIMLHGALDENPMLRTNMLDFIGADDKDQTEIKDANEVLLKQIKAEMGIETGIKVINSKQEPAHGTKMIMMASTGSDSGKTFLTTGIIGALRKRGMRVAAIKVGPDIRDIVPSLYLNKEKMENFSSIKIGDLGWMDLDHVIKAVNSNNYDLVIVEGVMSIFTGLLNEKVPFSSAEIALAANLPVIMVSPCNKGGIETAAIDLTAHAEMMEKLGINTVGLILNKVYDSKIAGEAEKHIKSRINPEYFATIPKVKLKERGNMPEVEIKLEDFCLNAIKTVENYLDLDEIVKLAATPNFSGYTDFNALLKSFN